MRNRTTSKEVLKRREESRLSIESIEKRGLYQILELELKRIEKRQRYADSGREFTQSLQQGANNSVNSARGAIDAMKEEADRVRSAEEVEAHNISNIVKAAELVASVYSGVNLLRHGWMKAAPKSYAKAIMGKDGRYNTFGAIFDNMDNGQILMSGVNGLADGTLTYYGSRNGNVGDVLVNGLQVPLDVLGAVGAGNFHRLPYFTMGKGRKYYNGISKFDTFMDTSGYTSAGMNLFGVDDYLSDKINGK